MPTLEEIRSFPQDPWKLLDLPRTACTEEIAAAYQAQSVNPASPEEAALIESAFHLIQTEEDRRRWRLLQPRAYSRPRNLLQDLTPRPLYSGPEAWLSILR